MNRYRNAKKNPTTTQSSKQTTLQIPAMGATLKSEAAGLVRTACECAGKSGRIRLFALMKAGVPSQPWNRLLLLYIALLAAAVHGNGKFFFSSWCARAEWRLMRGVASAPYIHLEAYTVYTMEHLPCVFNVYTGSVFFLNMLLVDKMVLFDGPACVCAPCYSSSGAEHHIRMQLI